MSTESLSANQVANLLKAMETAHGDKTAHGDMDSIAEQRQSARRDAGKADIGDAGDGEAAPNDDGTALPDTDRRAPAVSSDVGAAADGPPATDRQPVTPYDFQRPDRVDNDLLQALWSLHETIAGSFAAAISHLLRTPLDVKLRSIDQLVYSEFVTSREKPSCLSVIKPAPLDGN